MKEYLLFPAVQGLKPRFFSFVLFFNLSPFFRPFAQLLRLKQGVLLNWVKNSGLYYKKHQTGIFMKIITFLQIVRSGKITASQKANLSINKRFLSINSKSAKNTSISKANVFQRNFEYTFDLKGNDQASPPLLLFFNGHFRERVQLLWFGGGNLYFDRLSTLLRKMSRFQEAIGPTVRPRFLL